MKKLMLLCGGLLLLVTCNKETTQNNLLAEDEYALSDLMPIPTQYEKAIAYFDNYGPTEKMRFFVDTKLDKEFVLVNECRAFEVSPSIAKRLETELELMAKTNQQRSNNVHSSVFNSTVRLQLYSNITSNSAYNTAWNHAINKMNTVGDCKINFSKTSGSNKIYVQRYWEWFETNNTTAVAVARYTAYSNKWRVYDIRINGLKEGEAWNDTDHKKRTAIHELCHAADLQHCNSGSHISGTTSGCGDAGSVMYVPTPWSPNPWLSWNDKKALRTLWPD